MSPKKADPKLSKRQLKKEQENPSSEKPAPGVASWIAKMAKMEKFKGLVQVQRACDVGTPYRLRRPTGILGLDIALAGGFHAGGCAQIHGAESVGKTYLAYRTAGMVQKNYGNRAAVLIVCTEIRIDKTFARKAGFCVGYSNSEIEHFETLRASEGLPPYTAEEVSDLKRQIGEVVIISGSNGEEALDVAYEAVKEGAFQLIVIESLGALLSADQEAGDVGDRVYGGSSVMLTNFMNKIYPLYMMDRPDGTMLETTLIGINQARAEIGGSPRGPKTHAAAGAYSWKHAQLASLELNKSSPIKASGDGPIIGREVRWDLTKGKAGTHDGKRGYYNYYHVPKEDPIFWKDVENRIHEWGIDSITEMVETAKGLGVIEAAGAWLKFSVNGNLLVHCQGSDKFADKLVSDPELQEQLRKRCLSEAKLPVAYTS
jgi:RecA/RadA recombinase